MNRALKAAREKAELTQAQAAKAAKVTESMYQRYEYGKSTPTVYASIRIARALQSTVEELFPLTE